VRELARQALSSVEGGYDLLAPKFDHTPFRTPDGVLAFPVGGPQPITSRGYWALLGFDAAMRVRNTVWHPPFVMYYRTCALHALRTDLTASGFTVTTVPLTALGRRGDGSPRYRLVLARTARRRFAE
jgi:hypothetical protein